MKISRKWLLDYINIKDLDDNTIATTLTNLGLEVEGIETISSLSDKVLVGKVLTAVDHPESDHLHICEVSIGEDEPLQIVCGAPNARAGIYVCVATVGTVLGEDFKIKPSKIRGVKSNGMLCSETELGIGSDDSGIVELEKKIEGIDDSYLGKKLADVLGLNDTVFELNITPNRSDCLGYLGVARELSAYLKRDLVQPKIDMEVFNNTSSKEKISITIENTEDTILSSCFCGFYAENVKIFDSPSWMKERLERSGVRSVNSIVDITNYVMLEYSQPIHAYDSSFIENNSIIVRSAKDKEKLTTLDGKEHELCSNDIVIADPKKIIGLAGVMGGLNSEIKDNTSSIIVEVAHFNSSKIRKTAKRYGFHTEASHRFERGIDGEALENVCKRIAYLLNYIAKLNSSDLPNIYQIHKVGSCSSSNKIALRMDRIKAILGYKDISQDKVNKDLQSLGFKLLDQTEGRSLFEVPSWRNDCFKEIDLIDEVARFIGFDNIHSHLPMIELNSGYEHPFISFVEKVRTAVATQGFIEAISFPFVSQKDITNLLVSDDSIFNSTIELQNPLVEENKYMQTTLIINLLKLIEKNRKQKNRSCRFFECSKLYYKPTASYESFSFLKEPSLLLNKREKSENRPKEYSVISGIIDQPYIEKSWNSPVVNVDYFGIKENVLSILSGFGIDPTFTNTGVDTVPFLNPKASTLIYNGKTLIGYCGMIHPRVASEYELGIKEIPAVFEIFIDPLFNSIQGIKKIDCSENKYPGVSRDLAVIVDSNVQFKDIDSCLNKFSRRNMVSFRLFDIYNMSESQKSIALNFFFKSSKRTLNDIEVDKEMEAILKHLQNNIGATLRQ